MTLHVVDDEPYLHRDPGGRWIWIARWSRGPEGGRIPLESWDADKAIRRIIVDHGGDPDAALPMQEIIAGVRRT